ncbi:hypothetical protein ACTBAC_004703 [Vibrio parahaemolyticus]|nr:hypothetical protein [Vibrio parahaemolyticus]EIU7550380.1 hypothetical protein [Vibrio vulnificus]EIZ1898570.1 hypothetical protein [Vibrio parahaemolyticus]EIZ1900448.1 hypothetical protein [Vibrio parahaemolyticus]EJA3093940.1 hypothetical protein [Vibrio parahaemolyticus]
MENYKEFYEKFGTGLTASYAGVTTTYICRLAKQGKWKKPDGETVNQNILKLYYNQREPM